MGPPAKEPLGAGPGIRSRVRGSEFQSQHPKSEGGTETGWAQLELQEADVGHGCGNREYFQIVALGISRDKEKARAVRVVAQG